MTSKAEKILLLRLKSIGDVVLTLPAVNLVRDHFPQARIYFLTSGENVPVLQGFAAVDEVLTLDRAALRSTPLIGIARTLALARRLRAERFDLAVDFQGYGETAMLTRLTRAPLRWGNLYRPGRRWAYTHAVPWNKQTHIADWNLALLHQCGLVPKPVRNEFRLPPESLASARSFLAQNRLLTSKPVLYLQPFTSSPQKDWPLANYLALASEWRDAGIQPVFGGGPSDLERLAPARQAGFATSAGVSLLTSAGLAAISTVVVGGVTGLLHLAVALQKRVVMLMGNAIHETGYPYQHREWAVAEGATNPVAAIPVSSVRAAVAKAMTESQGREPSA